MNKVFKTLLAALSILSKSSLADDALHWLKTDNEDNGDERDLASCGRCSYGHVWDGSCGFFQSESSLWDKYCISSFNDNCLYCEHSCCAYDSSSCCEGFSVGGIIFIIAVIAAIVGCVFACCACCSCCPLYGKICCCKKPELDEPVMANSAVLPITTGDTAVQKEFTTQNPDGSVIVTKEVTNPDGSKTITQETGTIDPHNNAGGWGGGGDCGGSVGGDCGGGGD